MSELYIGLISGTSADGIDAALVDFSTTTPTVIGTHYQPYPSDIREKVLSLCKRGEDEIERLGELDALLGKTFAKAVQTLLEKQSLTPATIKAIGSHGQTIRHRPQLFTLQIADPNIIAAETGITTVADFRRKDMAQGGQGAPLVPAFHEQILASKDSNRIIVNIGGIANITVLNKNKAPVIGFDTGPGNVLLDTWIAKHQQKRYDENGSWGAEGEVDPALLQQMLTEPYFKLPAPKSTGRELFHSEWLDRQLNQYQKAISPVDVQATLVELTAQSILDAIRKEISEGEVLICGGGAHNQLLMERLKALGAPNYQVASTMQYGIDPDWVEALAFAWLAKQTLQRAPGNLPSVTGAKRATILGGIYYA